MEELLPLIVILGPTASGKTRLAVHTAFSLDGEVISADSRQVYRNMNIGTGKDLVEYTVEGRDIPHHLIDIADPGYEYNLFEYQRDFHRVYREIRSRGKAVILCGGSGLYLESVLSGYRLSPIQRDTNREKMLSASSTEDLIEWLKRLRILHNTTDTTDRARLIKAVMIGLSEVTQPDIPYPPVWPGAKVFGLAFNRQILKQRITFRLQERLNQGMISEVEELLRTGLSPDQLKFYGLEYRYITGYLCREYSYDEMVELLNKAIHQFAKRQMTWFRRMERRGIKIWWLDPSLSLSDMIRTITDSIPKITE